MIVVVLIITSVAKCKIVITSFLTHCIYHNFTLARDTIFYLVPFIMKGQRFLGKADI